MMLSELHDLDSPAPHWIIPRLRTKNKKTEHTVPLSPAAVDLILRALEISKEYAKDKNDVPVFASRYKRVTTLARHSLSQAVRRIVAQKSAAIAQSRTRSGAGGFRDTPYHYINKIKKANIKLSLDVR